MTVLRAGSRSAAVIPVEQMRLWYLAGDSSSTIGLRVGLHPGTVRRVLIESGVTMRTRAEQVALTDARVGVRAPTIMELVAGYVDEGLTAAELAGRYGMTESRVYSNLRRRGVQQRRAGIRPERVEAERAQRRPAPLVDEIIALYQSGLPLVAVAAQVDAHRTVVRDVLQRAGVDQRPQRKLPPVTEWANRYVDGGETAAEIAATYSASSAAVLHALAAAGIERRPAKVRMPTLSDDAVVACYVDARLSVRATAKRLGVSIPRVRAAVARLGILRTPFDPSTVDRSHFRRRHAAGATLAELADEFNLTHSEVSVAIRSFDLPPRLAVTHRPLTISDRHLKSLIVAGHSDTDIAAQYGVAVWAVVRRRRQSGLRRPPPNKVQPPISRDRLIRQLAAGKTRADIATAHHVGLDTVTRWCAHYDLDVVTSRPAGNLGVELDVKQLRHWYVAEQWSTHQIGNALGVDSSLVVFALHSHRIPVRHGAHGTQADAVVLLDALYADPEIVIVLERHQVPLRRRAGTLNRRFPHPPPLAASLVDDLYRNVGLSASHIALLTGHSPSNVYDVLRRHGTPARAGSRSPWYTRTFP